MTEDRTQNLSPQRGESARQTMDLRFAEINRGNGTQVRLLQQCWVYPDGTKEWRNVPLAEDTP
jgi:hypothetical protein